VTNSPFSPSSTMLGSKGSVPILLSAEVPTAPCYELLFIMDDLLESEAVDLYMSSSPVTYLARGGECTSCRL